jgi:hypothetical protein
MKISDLNALLTGLVSDFLDFGWRLVGALLILFFGWIIARILTNVLRKLLVRIGLDRLVQKLEEIDIVRQANIDIKLSQWISKLLYYFFILIVIVIAVEVFQMPGLSDLLEELILFLPHLLAAMVILFLGLIFSDAVAKIVRSACDSFGVPSSRLVGIFAFYFLFINIALIALDQAGVETEFLESNLHIIVGGIVLAFAIGYGLAARGVAANFMGSFYSRDRFELGQYIRIGEKEGTITNVSRTSITLESREGDVVIPMHKLAEEIVIIVKN